MSVSIVRTTRALVALILGLAGLTAIGLAGAGTATAAPGDSYTLTPSPTSVVAGGMVKVTIQAINPITMAPNTTDTSKVDISSSDAAATFSAASVTLVAGTGTFMATLRTSGNQTLTGTNDANPLQMGTSANIAVTAGPASKITVTAPTTATAGTAVNAMVKAVDQFGNTDTTYTKTVHMTSTDPFVTLPATDPALAAGAATVPVTFHTAGTQTVTATPTTGAITPGTSGNVTVAALTTAATKLSVTAPSTAVKGTAVNVTVTARDANNNQTSAYTGTVHFTSTDMAATLPGDTTLVNGTGTLPVTFNTVGSQTVTATDKATATITGTSAPATTVGLTAAPDHLTLTAPTTASAGSAVSVVVAAKDSMNATVMGYVGTVTFTSTDGMAILPADYTFTAADGGSHSFMVTFKTTGSQSVTATDKTTATIKGTSNTVAVTAATTMATTTQVGSNPAALRALVTATASSTGTTPPTPTGSVAFTVNGANAGTAMLDANGVATLAYTLKAGTQKIVATYAGATGFSSSTGNRTVTGPTVTASPTSASPKTSYGWYRSNVKVTYSCTAGSAAVVACPGVTTLSQQGAKVSVTKTIVGKDGGRTTVTTTVKLDKGKPTVHVNGVQSGHTYATPPHLTCKGSDSLSGVASCKITKKQQGKTVSYTATATDKAGNTAVAKGTYKLK